MSVAMTGSPLAAASMADRGKPSRYDGRAKTPGVCQFWLGDGIGLVGIGTSDDHEDHLWVRGAEALRRQEELAEALSPNETPDHPHNHCVAVDTEVGPSLSANFILRFGTKTLEVDAVAEQHQLAARNTEACQHLKILGVLDKLGS
jgi:hypothetical protein